MKENREAGSKTYELFDFPCPNCGESTFTLILKPAVTHRVICPKCRSPAYVHVGKNFGITTLTGEEYGKNKCSKCNGTGKCSDCKGTGMTICTRCDGKGFYEEDGWTPDYYGCEYCGGSGRTSNRADVYRTKDVSIGKGTVLCKGCMGTGVCVACDGEGLRL